jgi:hypothetical protein
MVEKHDRSILLTKHLFHACTVLLHDVNMRHGNDDFTSPLQEGVRAADFITLKIHRPRPGLNPRTLGPVASTLTTRPQRATWLIFPIDSAFIIRVIVWSFIGEDISDCISSAM